MQYNATKVTLIWCYILWLALKHEWKPCHFGGWWKHTLFLGTSAHRWAHRPLVCPQPGHNPFNPRLRSSAPQQLSHRQDDPAPTLQSHFATRFPQQNQCLPEALCPSGPEEMKLCAWAQVPNHKCQVQEKLRKRRRKAISVISILLNSELLASFKLMFAMTNFEKL